MIDAPANASLPPPDLDGAHDCTIARKMYHDTSPIIKGAAKVKVTVLDILILVFVGLVG